MAALVRLAVTSRCPRLLQKACQHQKTAFRSGGKLSKTPRIDLFQKQKYCRVPIPDPIRIRDWTDGGQANFVPGDDGIGRQMFPAGGFVGLVVLTCAGVQGWHAPLNPTLKDRS
ncbi:hypothetical protein [Candidatus Magnetaquiglobus chichijimensis]|uniref:hypothetical protein n=1 Tax=Candidatus Magnetaquiglobus chichijimensis TaxID=3141448 RepID=UPI003B972FD7